MRLLIVAVGQRVPDWAQTAYDDYAKRFPHEIKVELKAVKTEPRGSKTLATLYAAERERHGVAGLVDAGGAALGVGQCGHACVPCGMPGRRQKIAAAGRSFAHGAGARKQACAVYTRRIVEFDR